MYPSLGDTETYVSPYQVTHIIQLGSKRTDQILLMSNTSSEKAHKCNKTVSHLSDIGAHVIQFSISFWLWWMTNQKWSLEGFVMYWIFTKLEEMS